ncbi:MAG: rod shape-determining protein MreC [Clostridia bacterium]|nr:rod shape-determining protein MreC [Clostridia bacterium]
MAKIESSGAEKKPPKKATAAAKGVKAKTTAGKRKNKGKQQGAAGRIFFGVLVGLAAVAVVFFIWARAQNELSVTENAVGSLISPVQSAVNTVTVWVRDRVSEIKDRNKLRADYEEAQLEIMSLEYRISQLEELEHENNSLRGLIEAQDRYAESDPVFAQVVARESGRWFDVFTINRGTLTGVTVGMSVINEDGLIGRIYEAGLNYSKVMTIIDSRSAVACLIQRTRDNGVMKGQITSVSESSSCNMYYVPSVNDIVPGDEVITSGLDELYPKGLVVGVVQEVSRQSDKSDQYVVVAPSVDFQRIENVLVLSTVPESSKSDLAPLPSATTRAKPTVAAPTATPDPAGTIAPSLAPNNWAYPTVTPDPNTTSAPIVGGERPEELWAGSN